MEPSSAQIKDSNIHLLFIIVCFGSHSRKGNCHDNACIESFFSHFKSEMFYLNDYQTKGELIQAIETYIYHYNYKRFQKRLNHRAPIEYRISMAV
ncbi:MULTISPECIES: IS3 family transposase [Bacillus]|uniref:IS3 family transposase n=1 Tax=Bacillus TaxID=1386 RepID=UPI0018CD59C4|nr:IS3 family transposase [Bacillus tropicus]MED2996739.1 IS3 family transposase [Bacillus tropicus]